MLANSRNRSTRGVDNDVDSDGFWNARAFHAKRKSGRSGARLERRILRAKEKREWKRATHT